MSNDDSPILRLDVHDTTAAYIDPDAEIVDDSEFVLELLEALAGAVVEARAQGSKVHEVRLDADQETATLYPLGTPFTGPEDRQLAVWQPLSTVKAESATDIPEVEKLEPVPDVFTDSDAIEEALEPFAATDPDASLGDTTY